MNQYAPKVRTLRDIELDLDMLLVNCTARRLNEMTDEELQRRYSRLQPKSVAYKLHMAKQRRAQELAAL